MTRWFRTLALAAACLLLCCGCSLTGSGGAGVDELLRAPRLTGEYGAVKDALDAALGENTQLKYPYSGEFLSPYLAGDWDGDGTADMAVLYQTSQSANVCLAVLQKDGAGAWQLGGTAEGLSATVESIRLVNLQPTGGDQILVGYSTQSEEYLAVYAWQQDGLQSLLQKTYTQYLIADVTGTGADDLVLLSRDAATEKHQIQLLTAGEEGFAALQAPALSPEKFSGIAAVSAGTGADGHTYLVLDGWTGATGSTLASVMLYYDGETGRLKQAVLPGTQDLYAASQRHAGLLTSRDLDGDGAVEIPAQPEDPGQIDLCQTRRLSFVVWRDYTAEAPQKSFGILDEEYGYYLELPTAWQGNLMLVDGAEEGTVELRSLSGEAHYLTLRIADVSESVIGWTRLRTLSSGQVQIRLGPDAGEGLTAAGFIRRIHLL